MGGRGGRGWGWEDYYLYDFCLAYLRPVVHSSHSRVSERDYLAVVQVAAMAHPPLSKYPVCYYNKNVRINFKKDSHMHPFKLVEWL